jgi:hypothetical protein
MRTKSKQIILLLATILLSSCVQKSKYDDALYVISKYEGIEKNLKDEISSKDQLIRQLQIELDECKNNVSDNFSNSLFNNKDKGKVELEFVETSLKEILQKINNCSNTDDLYDIQRETKNLNEKVSSYLFFNY